MVALDINIWFHCLGLKMVLLCKVRGRKLPGLAQQGATVHPKGTWGDRVANELLSSGAFLS